MTASIAMDGASWDTLFGGACSGSYLATEPMLQKPNYLASMASSGMAVPSYAYALNNPVGLVDVNGKNPAAVAVGGGTAIAGMAIVGGTAYWCLTHPEECAQVWRRVMDPTRSIPTIDPTIRWEPNPDDPNTQLGRRTPNRPSSAQTACPTKTAPSPGPLRDPKCSKVADDCRIECGPTLGGPPWSQSIPFYVCVNACLVLNGCPPGMY